MSLQPSKLLNPTASADTTPAMAFRPLLRQRAVLPTTAAALAAGTVFFPRTTLHAEAAPEMTLSKKPIYDDLPRAPKTPKYNPSNPDTRSATTIPAPAPGPTPTDRLATHVRAARLFLHAQSSAAETRLNKLMSSLLHLESSFTTTVASLAPPPSSHEKLVPGGIYVLVAAMAGSIVSRNRNILLRATVPLAVGVGAGWVVLPVTMRNVGDLLWRYEERVPVVAENHLRVRGAAVEGWRQAVLHGEAARRWSEERIREGREVVEGWVQKGS